MILENYPVIHIDFDGTLFDTFFETDPVDGKYYYVCTPQPFSIEVTRLLAAMGHELVCITMGSTSETGSVLLEGKREVMRKHFPWFKRIMATPRMKQYIPEVKFLIDDSSFYLDDGFKPGIYLAPVKDHAINYVADNVMRATSWYDIAILLGLIEEPVCC